VSVINKMLRDLDGRVREQGFPSNGPVALASVTRGTASVIRLPLGKASARRGTRLLVLWLLVPVVVAGAVWSTGRFDATPPRSQSGAPQDAVLVEQRSVEPLPVQWAARPARETAPALVPNGANVAAAGDPVQSGLRKARVLQLRPSALMDSVAVVQAPPVSALPTPSSVRSAFPVPSAPMP